MKYINKVTGKTEKVEDIESIVRASITIDEYIDMMDDDEFPVSFFNESYGIISVLNAVDKDRVKKMYDDYIDMVTMDVIHGEVDERIPIEIVE